MEIQFIPLDGANSEYCLSSNGITYRNVVLILTQSDSHDLEHCTRTHIAAHLSAETFLVLKAAVRKKPQTSLPNLLGVDLSPRHPYAYFLLCTSLQRQSKPFCLIVLR